MPSGPQSEDDLPRRFCSTRAAGARGRAALAAWVGRCCGVAGRHRCRRRHGCARDVAGATGRRPRQRSSAGLRRRAMPTVASEAAPQAADDARERRHEAASASRRGPTSSSSTEVAYRLVGPSTLEKSQLTLLGTTTTSLDGGAMRARDVYGRDRHPGGLHRGRRRRAPGVQAGRARRSRDAPTSCSSADLAAFGIWPALPAGIATPSSSDGSPTFIGCGRRSVGRDDLPSRRPRRRPRESRSHRVRRRETRPTGTPTGPGGCRPHPDRRPLYRMSIASPKDRNR